MMNLLTIDQALNNFKNIIESSIKENGEKGKESAIRSSKPIQNIHEAVKSELIRKSIRNDKIFPPINSTKPELPLAGFIKQKNQDICIIPENINKIEETLTDGILNGIKDSFGKEFTEKTISINVRSQISSLAKNFDTLYERTIAESQNLHTRCPKMCLGEVYLIAVPEYDSVAVKSKDIKFNNTQLTVEKYIKSFQIINERKNIHDDYYKYESVCLLIVDFSQDKPYLYNTTDDLIKNKLVTQDVKVNLENLNWESFFNRLLTTYSERFNI